MKQELKRNLLVLAGVTGVAATAGAWCFTAPKILIRANAPTSRAASTKQVVNLGSGHVGIWGAVPWQTPGENYGAEYYDRVKDFDFGIRNIRMKQETNLTVLDRSLSQINDEINVGEKVHKFVILEIDFWDGNERSRPSPPVQERLVYEKRMKFVLDRVHWNNPAVVGISLSEENSPLSNGRASILSGLYDYCHTHYPGIFVFQWYTPNTSLPIPEVPADGYIIDPYTLCPEMYPDSRYHMGSDPYQWLLRKYLDTGKKVIDIIYASNGRSFWYDKYDPKNKYGFDERQIMDHQFELNQKYNVPTAFYWENWDELKGKGSTTFKRSEVTSPLLNEINEKVKSYAARAHGG